MAKSRTSNSSVKATKVSKNSKVIKKADKSTKWTHSKVKDNDFFSEIQYMKVINIYGDAVFLANSDGKTLGIEKKVLQYDAFSANHFEKEVTCNMTELSEILQSARDTIFTVEFKKQADATLISSRLAGKTASEVKDLAMTKDFAKGIVEGESCVLTGHLVKSEQHMGRSLVIDLNAPAGFNFRQVDHRTIQFIILKNVKYSLGKKSTLSTLDTSKNTDIKWNLSKIAIGDWFSQVQYFKLNSRNGDMWNCSILKDSNMNYQIPAEQVKDMYSATLFDSEEKVTKTQMVEIFQSANEAVFTITFNVKVQPEEIATLLSSIKSQADLDNRKKELSKQLIEGKLTTITGFLAKREESLGRSLVIDLTKERSKAFRQVDHRSIKELVLKNVKYTLKN